MQSVVDGLVEVVEAVVTDAVVSGATAVRLCCGCCRGVCEQHDFEIEGDVVEGVRDGDDQCQ